MPPRLTAVTDPSRSRWSALPPFLLWLIWASCLPLPAGAAPCADYAIGRYTSIPWGFSTNSYWVEGPAGVVLIDTQFLPSAAREAVAVAESYTGKKVTAALVLHANPDKFNGTAVLAEHGAEVLTSAPVRALIPGVDALRRSWFEARYRPDYPDHMVLPDSFGDATATRNLAGLEFKLHVLGPAASKAHVVAELDGHLFVGDLVANRHHAWLELGQLDPWIEILQRLKALQPRHVHPGRGYEGGPELLDRQIDYLRLVKTRVAARHPAGELDGATKQALIEEIEGQYPGYGNSYFLNLGLPAVWQALSAEPQ